MPTNEQYTASIVEKYQVAADGGSGSHRAVDEITPLVKHWGKQYLQGITLSGAYAKNTAITLTSHVDVLITMSPVPDMEMKKFFGNLFEFLTLTDLKPQYAQRFDPAADSGTVGRSDSGVPGSRHLWKRAVQQEDGHGCAYGCGASTFTWWANSGRQQEICALKIWRERNGLDFPSLYLELTVLRALEGERFGQLADNMLSVFRYLSHRFEQAEFSDPANLQNKVSGDLSAEGRQAIAVAARGALYDENWKKILW